MDSVRLMLSSLSNIADNLSEGLHKGICTDCKSCLMYVNVKDGALLLNCLEYNKNYEKKLNDDQPKDLKTSTDSVTEALINFV